MCALGCAASDPDPLAGGGPGSSTSPGWWLLRADQAEERGDAEAALRCLERWERDFPQQAGEEHWRRRLRLAAEAGDPDAELLAQHELLRRAPGDDEARFRTADLLAASGGARSAAALLDRDYADAPTRLRAWRRISDYLALDGDCAAAAERMERAADDPAAGAAAHGWWERASRLWEQAGDRARAARALERALEGVPLDEREREALARLRAFESGAIESVADACAVLRFHDDAELRIGAARYLAARRFPDEVAVFGRALADPAERVVVISLAEMRARSGPAERLYAASCARALVGDPRAAVRREAVGLLGATGAESDLPLLLEALDPEDRAGFRAARRALEELSGHSEPAPLDPDLDGRRALRAAWLRWMRERGGT